MKTTLEVTSEATSHKLLVMPQPQLDHILTTSSSSSSLVPHYQLLLFKIIQSMVQIKEAIFQELWSDFQNHQREVVGLDSEKLGV